MAVFSEALALLVFLTTALSQRPPDAQVPKDYIIDVKQECGEEGTQTTVCVMTDLNVFIQLECKGGYLYNFTSVDRLEHCSIAHFTGDETKTCVYPKRHDLRLYCVKVLVNVVGKEGSSVGINRMIRYTMTCTYDENGDQVSGNSSIVEQYHAPNAVNGHAGKETAKGVTILLTDIRGVPLKSGIPIDKTVCLKVLLDNSTGLLLDSTPISLFPVSCEAIGTTTGHRHAIVRAGCGDGIIIHKTKGFSMKPPVALPPYLQVLPFKKGTPFPKKGQLYLGPKLGRKKPLEGPTPQPKKQLKLFWKGNGNWDKKEKETPGETQHPGRTRFAKKN
uniref:Vitelline envelope zona pellucida domain protein 15 n=1 Tax=Haliotis rufescens TaxID=6454 RepID=D0EL53_HALRU|nr:vitelline envelope zona pellucida domain protein 15 [Haliotis rufescens]